MIAALTVAAITVGAGVWALVAYGPSARSDAEPEKIAACPATQTVLTDPTVAPVLQNAAKDYAAFLGRDCSPITIGIQPSVDVARQGLGTAAAWIPEDIAWHSRASTEDQRLATATMRPLGWSPLVSVAPEALANSLDGKPLKGPILTDLVTAQTTFANYGHPEWGRIKLVLPAVADSVTGAGGLNAIGRQIAGGETFPPSVAGATPAQRQMRTVQWRTVAEPSPADVLGALDPTPADAPVALGVGPRVGVTSEVVAVNRGAQVGLTAWHLDDGRSAVRIGMLAPPGDPTIDGFGTWLTSEEGKRSLLSAGLRVGDRAPASGYLGRVDLPTEGISEPAGLSAREWGLLTQVYATFRHRAVALTVLDVSGSMGERYPGSDLRRVDAIGRHTAQAWSSWPPGTVTGLMTFNADPLNRPVINTVVPLQPNNTQEYIAALPRYASQFQQIPTSGGTPLYEAILAGYETMQREYRQGYSHTIIVVTDGKNEDSTSTLTANALIERIQKGDPNKRVNIGLVGLGAQADFAELKRIADATGNRAWLVEDTRSVSDVLRQIDSAYVN